MNVNSLLGIPEAKNTDIHKDDLSWLNRCLKQIPTHMRTKVRGIHKQKLNQYGYKTANSFVRETVKSITERLAPIEIKKPLPWAIVTRKDRVEDMAERLAMQCAQRIAEYADVDESYNYKLKLIYVDLSSKLEGHYINAPYHFVKDKTPENYESALLKMSCDQWWRRKLLNMRKQCLEALQIALGNVKKGKGNYCSNEAVGEWRQDQAKNLAFLDKFELENELGDVINLKDAYLAGVGNPKHRRTELMVRMRGLEELAQEENHIGLFFTLTAPSKFHRTRNKGYHLNPKWAGYTPKDTQEYLCKLWAKVRSAWKKENIQPYGFRVVEPHTDGTPHWHILLFFQVNQAERATNIFRSYAISEDSEELTAGTKARFDVEEIDPSKGSATGYIAKYIAKNIAADDLALNSEPDFETGGCIADGVERVRAWASRWNIRQFQQIGGAPVTVYRELRRLDELEENHILEPIRSAADSAKFAEFVKLMRSNQIKIQYETEQNQYAETVKKIVGVSCFSSSVITRIHDWVRQSKGQHQKESGAFPWTRGNNCTNSEKNSNTHENSKQSKFKQAVKAAGLDDFACNLLLRGCQVTAGNGVFKVRNGQLIHMGLSL